ncbi:MAG: hypothetical protein ACXW3D_10040 [Caulobacteraceae bacterium]
MTDAQKSLQVHDATSLADIARQEFWIVAKTFLAPVFGTFLVLRFIRDVTRIVDE